MKRKWIILWGLAVWMLLAAAGNAAFAGRIIYVDADANGLNDGTSWRDAYKYLQDALADANSSTKPVEIRVAQETYRPDEDILHPGGTGNQEDTFQLINGVTLKGGYAGFGEPDPNARDIERYKTILSGDLYGNDVEVKDPCDLLTEPTRAENSYHIFYHPKGLNLDATAILDGFTITGGNANGSSWPHTYGGGMLNNWLSKPTVENCTFSGNSATVWGGGMYNSYASSSAVTGCTFSGNSANDGGGMVNLYSGPTLTNCTFSGNSANHRGGGMVNAFSNPTLTNCTFSGNSATEWGGGMSNGSSISTLTNCTFSSNSAKYFGGGMYNSYNASLTLNNCIFSSNSAKYGGGMYNYFGNKPTLTNCTIANNSAPNGPAIACDSDSTVYPSNVKMVNCIVWNGFSWLWNNDESTITVTYSDVQGGWPGERNINADPCFADVNNVDYHLKSQAGRWEPSENPKSEIRNPKLMEGSWVKDNVTSPCIDTGDSASPIGLEPFPNGGRINMGAYGGTAEASKSYFREPVCETIVSGDINGDCNVDFWDFAIIAGHWLEVPAPEREVKVTEVKIIKGELVEGLFQEIEEVDKLIVGDVFLIKIKVLNLRHETVNVLNLYGWDLSPQNYVEVIGSDSGCATYYELEPGESAFLRPFCITHAFKAEQNGWVTMNISVGDWVFSNLCDYTFTFEIVSSE